MSSKMLCEIVCLAAFGLMNVPARAGLINAGSTVDIYFGSQASQTSPSQVFDTGAPGPFSLDAPIIPPTPPLHTTEPYNITADTGFWFTDTQVTIYNNYEPPPPAPFEDPYSTFDFIFTKEDITGLSIDPSSSADFQPATLTLVSPNEFLVVIGDGVDPAYLSTLVINVATSGVTPVPEPSVWAMMIVGFLGLGFAAHRRKALLTIATT